MKGRTGPRGDDATLARASPVPVAAEEVAAGSPGTPSPTTSHRHHHRCTARTAPDGRRSSSLESPTPPSEWSIRRTARSPPSRARTPTSLRTSRTVVPRRIERPVPRRRLHRSPTPPSSSSSSPSPLGVSATPSAGRPSSSSSSSSSRRVPSSSPSTRRVAASASARPRPRPSTASPTSRGHHVIRSHSGADQVPTSRGHYLIRSHSGVFWGENFHQL